MGVFFCIDQISVMSVGVEEGDSENQQPKDLMTVLITTSPAHTHPSTCLLDQVLETFLGVPQLIECRTIIICDGYHVTDSVRYKKGRVTPEQAATYEEYKKRLHQRIEQNDPRYQNTELFELEERAGFGFALQKALPLVTTPFLMVVQHDRSFIKDFDLLGILHAMEIHPKMRYVLLPMASTANYRKRMDTKFRARDLLVGHEVEEKDLYFLPLCQFYDSTHIAHIDFYHDFVVGQKMIPKNGFIEDRVGQRQAKDIRENGMAAHSRYGTYLFGDGFEYVVQHLDGRDSLTENQFTWQRDENGICRRVVHGVPFFSREEARLRETTVRECEYDSLDADNLFTMFDETND